MLFKINYHCTATGKRGKARLEIPFNASTTVQDLKLEIQRSLHAPVCDQRISYQGQSLTKNSLRLSELYLRENDEFYLEFLAEAEIEKLDMDINEIKSFYSQISHLLTPEMENCSLEKLEMSIFPNIEVVKVALGRIAYQYFTPWKQGRALSHRHYFVQEGGFDAFLGIFRFSQKRFGIPKRLMDNPDVSNNLPHLSGFYRDLDGDDGNDDDDDDDEEQDDEHGFMFGLDPELLILQQLTLQASCLGLLWNFTETAADRQLGFQKGCLTLAIESLMVDPPTNDLYPSSMEYFWQRVSINEEAIGCVAGFVEHNSESQRLVSGNKPLVRKILDMLIVGEYYGIFYRQLAINLLFYCSFDSLALEMLVEQNVHLNVMQFLKKQLEDDTKDIVFRYYSSLFLARVRTAQRFTLSPRICAYIDNVLIEGLLSAHQPYEIAEWEEDHSYVWITLKALVHLAFAGGRKGYMEVTECEVDQQSVPTPLVENVLFQLGLEAYDDLVNDDNGQDFDADSASDVSIEDIIYGDDDNGGDDNDNYDNDDDYDGDNYNDENDDYDHNDVEMADHMDHSEARVSIVDKKQGQIDERNCARNQDVPDVNQDPVTFSASLTTQGPEAVNFESSPRDISCETPGNHVRPALIGNSGLSKAGPSNCSCDMNASPSALSASSLPASASSAIASSASASSASMSSSSSLSASASSNIASSDIASSANASSAKTSSASASSNIASSASASSASMSSASSLSASASSNIASSDIASSANASSAKTSSASASSNIASSASASSDVASSAIASSASASLTSAPFAIASSSGPTPDVDMELENDLDVLPEQKPEHNNDDDAYKNQRERFESCQNYTKEAENLLKVYPFVPPLPDNHDILSLVKQAQGNKRMMWPGSSAVQKLGVFSLRHLLFSSGNRDLVLQEKLLDYLVCLKWQMEGDARSMLTNELTTKFHAVQPPSLRVMSKAVLAQIYGFDAVNRF
ncbi:uncharacterized protein LOC116620908 [Nematostella vectensis]|uniref:uncharacterized protein LOC116620908 n=1 Tax=Nematostella vectensis TaxID=45351 RepID=UPI0020771311|nr:uncharacterized protein LOC116620908 [Nematostella vectensis]